MNDKSFSKCCIRYLEFPEGLREKFNARGQLAFSLVDDALNDEEGYRVNYLVQNVGEYAVLLDGVIQSLSFIEELNLKRTVIVLYVQWVANMINAENVDESNEKEVLIHSLKKKLEDNGYQIMIKYLNQDPDCPVFLVKETDKFNEFYLYKRLEVIKEHAEVKEREAKALELEIKKEEELRHRELREKARKYLDSEEVRDSIKEALKLEGTAKGREIKLLYNPDGEWCTCVDPELLSSELNKEGALYEEHAEDCVYNEEDKTITCKLCGRVHKAEYETFNCIGCGTVLTILKEHPLDYCPKCNKSFLD